MSWSEEISTRPVSLKVSLEYQLSSCSLAALQTCPSSMASICTDSRGASAAKTRQAHRSTSRTLKTEIRMVRVMRFAYFPK